MAYVAPTSRATGYLVSASEWNKNTVDNPIAIYAGAMSIASQVANDLIFAQTATQLARLGNGTNGQVLLATTSSPPSWSSELLLLGSSSVRLGNRTGQATLQIDGGATSNLFLEFRQNGTLRYNIVYLQSDSKLWIDPTGSANVGLSLDATGNGAFTGNLSIGAAAIGTSITSSATALSLVSRALGTGGVTGPVIFVGRNSSGNGAAGYVGYTDNAGVIWPTWVDATGDLRISTDAPQEDGAPSDTSGTVVGDQTSQRALKNIYGTYTDYRGALDTILAAKLWDFDYKSGSRNGQRFIGITTDDDPIFGMDEGRSFNPVTTSGLLIGAIKELDRRLAALEERG